MAKKRGNNEGSIYKREDGRWRVQITVNGKRLSHTGDSYKECREWMQSTQHKIETGLTFDKSHITLEEFHSNWLASAKSSLRPRTWFQYNQISRDYILPSLGRIKLVDLRPDHVQAMYDQKVIEGKGLRTVQLIHAITRRTLNRAVKLGILERNPVDATTPPKPELREMRILDDAEAQQLLISAQTNQSRYMVLYQLALTTGMRQGELLGLQWQDVDWKRNTIYVQRQLKRKPGGGMEFAPPKTKSGIRKVAVGHRTISLLKEHRENQFSEIKALGDSWQDHDLLFPSTIGTPFNQRNLTRRFKKLLKNAGLPNIRFHDLRHSAASLMLNNGIPVLVVSKRLGHAKPSITLDVYGHLIPSIQEQAAEVMDEVITPVELYEIAPVAPGLHRKISELQKLDETTPHIQVKT